MNIIYNLIIEDLELYCENDKERFNIGFFTTYDKAYSVAEKYLTEIEDFNKYPCKYEIIEKIIRDFNKQISCETVYIIYGWNIDKNYNETDVIESDCFITQETAQSELDKMKQKYSRIEWCIDKYKLDECSWTEGFIKI